MKQLLAEQEAEKQCHQGVRVTEHTSIFYQFDRDGHRTSKKMSFDGAIWQFAPISLFKQIMHLEIQEILASHRGKWQIY